MTPESETLARMIAAVGILTVGAMVVTFVGWIIRL